jgi:hypothetical protein
MKQGEPRWWLLPPAFGNGFAVLRLRLFRTLRSPEEEKR